MKKIIYLGSPIPEDAIDKYKTLSYNMADNIAQNSLLKGLDEFYAGDLSVVSELSTGNNESLILDTGIAARVVKTNGVNRFLYYLSLLFGYTKTLNHILKQSNIDPNRDTIIITRGAYIYIALPVLLARFRYSKIKWVPFIITTVEVPEYGFPLSIVSKMSKYTAKRADGVITYVAKTAEDYMPDKPFVEIAYGIREQLISLYKKKFKTTRKEKFTITYTGSLSNTYNFKYVIDAIKKTSDRYHWVFAGEGLYADEIKLLASDKKYNVEYMGIVSNKEAIELQKSSHLLICPRGGNPWKVGEYYSKYAASAKLIEYLCSGTPILASDVPSTIDRIKPFITKESHPSADCFVRDIELIEEDYKKRLTKAKEGQEYAFKYFNADYQNKIIYKFLESL